MSSNKNDPLKIVEWSGGPDSTYTLVNLLENETCQVEAWHDVIIIVDPETYKHTTVEPYRTFNRYKLIQYYTTKKLFDILNQKFRPFQFRRDILFQPLCKTPTDEGNWEINQSLNDMFKFTEFTLLLPILLERDNITLYLSHCAEDWITQIHFTENNYAKTKEYEQLADILRSLGVGVVYDNKNLPKAEICNKLQSLGLWELTWSCPSPGIDNKPCGICEKCIDRKNAENNIRGDLQ